MLKSNFGDIRHYLSDIVQSQDDTRNNTGALLQRQLTVFLRYCKSFNKDLICKPRSIEIKENLLEYAVDNIFRYCLGTWE